MIELFNKLFGRQNSSATAKERLRLVLLSDHLSLAPELVDKLKAELIEVLSRYVEVDRTKIEVNFEQHERANSEHERRRDEPQCVPWPLRNHDDRGYDKREIE